MASSNRHWPSMFKSKPCNTHHHQWQHDINSSLISSSCHRSPFTSGVPGCEERSPDPKPRWNPKPEQIRILEAIFNSGMVNPPRDEIRKIRAQLQEYGQVGDANVFYWFQNRKSRSKHKQRHLQNSKSNPQQTSQTTTSAAAITAPSSSSSSSSEKSSPNSSEKAFSSVGSLNFLEVSNSPMGSASNQQPYFQTTHGEFLPEPFFFPATGGLTTQAVFAQGFCFPELMSSSGGVGGGVHHHVPNDQTVGNCSGFLLSDLMMNHGPLTKRVEEDGDQKMKLQQQQLQTSYTVSTAHTTTTTSSPTIVPSPTVTVPSSINHIQGAGVGETGTVGPVNPARSTVFINDVAVEVAVGPFNVREAFGDDAVLIHSTGQPVLTNEWGVTLHSLHHGAFYYLI